MEKKHYFNLEDVLENTEETFFTVMVAIAVIAPFLTMFIK